MVPFLVFSAAIQERFFTSLQWIFQRSVVSKSLFQKLWNHQFPSTLIDGWDIKKYQPLLVVFYFDKSYHLVCWLSIFPWFVGLGGQSALRFARLRMEKRRNYVKKVAETAVQLYITNDRVSDKV